MRAGSPDRPGPDNGDSNYSRDSWRRLEAEEGWREKRERGVKPKKFRGDRSKMMHFLVEFGRYLRLNKEVYPTESDTMDLFLLCIDHP